MSAPFHFVVFLRSFLIGEALLLLYAVKKSLNISTLVINYHRVIAVYINYGSGQSPRYKCVHVSWLHYFLGYEIITMTCSSDVDLANQ